jgi:hypothetical protein
VFLLIAMFELPVAAYWIELPNWFRSSTQSWFWSWVFYDFIPSFFGVALIIAALTIIALAVRRNWKSIPQCCIEIALCIFAAVLLPAY